MNECHDTYLDDVVFTHLLSELVELCMRECFTADELSAYSIGRCARKGCENTLKGKRRGSKYCGRNCQHLAYTQRRWERSAAGAAMIAGETYDGNNARKLKVDPLVTHVTVSIRIPRKLKVALWNAAKDGRVTQERFICELLERELNGGHHRSARGNRTNGRAGDRAQESSHPARIPRADRV
jgi:hypothetical protein